MRCLNRNKRPFSYALYEGREAVTETDEWGNVIETGEYTVKYSNPVSSCGNFSPASGSMTAELFGGNEGYDKVLTLDNPNCPIDEYSILWVDADTTQTYDYVVKKVARSLNSVSIAISKVNVR